MIKKNNSTEMSEKQLIEEGYKKYTSNAVDVFFKKDICTHSGNCVNSLPLVFDLNKKPWIDIKKADLREISKCIDGCPSGALKYIIKGDRL